MESAAAIRRPCFIGEDDGLASLAELEAGFSGNSNHHPNHPVFSRSAYYSIMPRRRGSFRSLSFSSSAACSSPRSNSARVCYDARFEEHQPHFLEACFLCKKPLGDKTDIFMYRGDTPFCSEECRQEQIEIDEAKEKNWNLSTSMKAIRSQKESNKSSSSSPSKSKNYPCRAGTVAAA
ncbi:hypothetical protein Ancab_032924 [Ancistrocladus abbreviatus]